MPPVKPPNSGPEPVVAPAVVEAVAVPEAVWLVLVASETSLAHPAQLAVTT